MEIQTRFKPGDVVMVRDGRQAVVDVIHVHLDRESQTVLCFVTFSATQFPLKMGYRETELRRWGKRCRVQLAPNKVGEGVELQRKGQRVEMLLDGADEALWYAAGEVESL
jgi:hypothetical protein